jgi:hypothetical protein
MGASVGGRELQHSLVTLQATCNATGSTFTFTLFQNVELEDGAEKKPTHDKNGKQYAYTIDKQKTDAKITTKQSEWYRFRTWLRQQAQAISAQIQQTIGIGQVEFDLTVTFGNTVQTRQTDRLGSAMIQKEAKKSSDNQDPLSMDIPLFVLEVADENSNHFVEFGS